MNFLLRQKLNQFLVHSFIYYQLDESLIRDTQYDEICRELRELLQTHQEEKIPYRDVAEPVLGEEASGFSIRSYPPRIISTSLHLLYQFRYREQMPFTQFLERYGYRAQPIVNE